jgi:hypothetical protein
MLLQRDDILLSIDRFIIRRPDVKKVNITAFFLGTGMPHLG